MEEIYSFISGLYRTYPFSFVVANALFVLGLFLLTRFYFGMKSARWVVENQYELAKKEDVDEMLAFADSKGRGDEARKVLTKIKMEFGVNRVKLGHVFWILEFVVVRGEGFDGREIPSFEKK